MLLGCCKKKKEQYSININAGHHRQKGSNYHIQLTLNMDNDTTLGYIMDHTCNEMNTLRVFPNEYFMWKFHSIYDARYPTNKEYITAQNVDEFRDVLVIDFLDRIYGSSDGMYLSSFILMI